LDNIYTIIWNEYKLEIIPAGYDTLSSPTSVYLDSRIISDLKIDWNIGDVNFGVISPKMSIEIDYNFSDSNLTDFINIISNPSLIDYYSGMRVELKNIFKLWKNDELIYVGVQDTGIEGNYDNWKQSIETTYFGRYILEQFDTKIFKEIINSTVIVPTTVNRQSYIDFFYSDTAWRLTGHTTPSKNEYLWFIPLVNINAFYKRMIEIIGSMLLRETYELTTLGNEGQTVNDKLFTVQPETNQLQCYKQTYDGSGSKGIKLQYDSDVYFIGFRATDEWVSGEANSSKIIEGLFFDKLNKSYKTVWDLFVDLTNQFVRVAKPSGYFYDFVTPTEVELDLYDVSIDFKYKILSRVSASLTESFNDDIDNYEVYNGSARTDNSLTIPIVFYNYPTTGDYFTSISSGWNNLFEINGVLGLINRLTDKNIKYFGIYYFENPDSRFHREMPFIIHNYINGYGASEYNLATTSMGFAEVLEIQRNGCIPKIISEYVLGTYNSNKQTKLSGKTDDMELYTLKTEFDTGTLAPPKQVGIFSEYTNTYYTLSKKIDYINEVSEIEFIGL